MKRNNKVSGSSRQLSLSGFRGFVNFASAIAAVWVVLLLAPQGFATATGAVKNTKFVVCTFEAIDMGADKGCNSSEVKSQAFLPGPSRCCEQSKDHKLMAETCQTSCPASGRTAIWVWQLPVHALLAMKFVPCVIGAPNSLLHQRLNRPPIIDRLA